MSEAGRLPCQSNGGSQTWPHLLRKCEDNVQSAHSGNVPDSPADVNSLSCETIVLTTKRPFHYFLYITGVTQCHYLYLFISTKYSGLYLDLNPKWK